MESMSDTDAETVCGTDERRQPSAPRATTEGSRDAGSFDHDHTDCAAVPSGGAGGAGATQRRLASDCAGSAMGLWICVHRDRSAAGLAVHSGGNPIGQSYAAARRDSGAFDAGIAGARGGGPVPTRSAAPAGVSCRRLHPAADVRLTSIRPCHRAGATFKAR